MMVFNIKFTIKTSDQDKKNIDNILENNQLKEKKLVIINPSTSNPKKNWSENYFAKVGDWININTEAKVLLVGSRRDYNKVERIINNMDNRAYNLAGQTNLKELTVLIKQANLLITGDTAAMHIGMTVGTSLVSLFGPTSPERYGPYLGENIVIKSSGDNINTIKAAKVIRGIKQILNKK